MKSLILTILYLAKDTLHRWLSRISSPLARVLVVFFLTLAALAGMGSYAISAKIITDKIVKNGGDTVIMHAHATPESPTVFPRAAELKEILNADSLALVSIGSAADENGSMPIYTFDFQHLGQMLPLMNKNGLPTVLVNAKRQSELGPTTVTVNKEKYQAVNLKLPQDHLLNRIIGQRALLVQPDSLPYGVDISHGAPFLILKMANISSAQEAQHVEQYLRTYMKLDGKQANIISAAAIFKQLEDALSKQLQCRIAFCLGISIIVGILLTALAGIEYRQNEYIYTLMKSFGIRPILLVGAFIAENLLLVFGSAAAALYTFMYAQKFIVTQLLKLGNYSIGLHEITTEIQLIGTTLLICIFISAIPVFIAAHRDIGRVLK
ncbi:MAG: hypothetical protein IJA81_09965 [Akkermansia sp.]|nr:hypothetical protein [Akkermansia sp.]